MRTIFHRLNFIPLLILIVVSSGCGTYVLRNPKTPFAGYSSGDKINLTVALNITDDLRNAQWERHNLGIRPGPYLAENCEILARNVFREVTTPGSKSPMASAVLTPKVVYINRTQGATSFGESITTVKLEWNLSDPSGKPVWIETVAGEARGSTGFSNPEKMLQKALEQLLANSQQTMLSSGAIHQFAAESQSTGVSARKQ